MSVEVGECDYRQECSSAEGSQGNLCGLLLRMVGERKRSDCVVSDETCRECAKWHRPTAEHPNPVVASLLYSISSELLREPLIDDDRRAEAQELNRLAVRRIAEEEDYEPVNEISNQQKNLDCECPSELVPRPSRRYGDRVVKWAVGVTTAPRDQATLRTCLETLGDAGWADPRIFIDGETEWEAIPAHLQQTRRDPRVGAWPNYYLALGELLMRSPEADAFLIVQDDVVLFRHVGLRDYLESILWPSRRTGIVSLFCSRAYSGQQPGWQKVKKRMEWGGQALIYSRKAVIDLLSDPGIVEHRFRAGGLANIDGVVGRWAEKRGVDVYVPTPSLAQHVGHVSSLWPKARLAGNRRADQFAGSDTAARNGK